MFENITVIGAGTMGNGIAHVFAQNAFKVSLVDVSPEQLNKGVTAIQKNLERQVSKGFITEDQKVSALQNIVISTFLTEGVQKADLVIEAASENLEIKVKIFQQLDEAAPPGCILASNTSSISITRLAAATKRPSNVIGMHFMNPVPLMKLVEVINGFSTSREVTARIIALGKALGKVPCEVNDYPGFISNRILMPMINEAIYSLYEGVAGVAEIDTVMTLGMSHPMGPLQLADFIGLDICYSILKVLQEGLGSSKYAPCPLLSNMVAANCLGIKSGEGFYTYTTDSKALVVSERFRRPLTA